MNKKLIITSFEYHHTQCMVIALEEDGKITGIQLKSPDNIGLLGNIYVGKVQKVVPHIRAAFIDIAPNCPCYYPIEQNEIPCFTSLKKDNQIKAGDELLVQVKTEAIKSKIPTVTSNLNLTGKYFVLTTGIGGIGLSGKLDASDKERLRNWVLPYKRDNCGIIIRTNAREVEEAVLLNELKSLFRRLDKISHAGKTRTCYSLIEAAQPEYVHMLENGTLDDVVTDDRSVFEYLHTYLNDFQPEDVGKLRLYEDTMLPLYKLYSLETILDQATREKVWLKSGGFLMIQQTEAFVAIDVNSGKYKGKKNAQETYRTINLEAAKEIAVQLRLRNLSGIILIDFINMVQKSHQDELLQMLQKYLNYDSVKAVVVDITALHIVEVTRKKIRKSLSEQIADIRSVNTKEEVYE